jgi:hypothetical protein
MSVLLPCDFVCFCAGDWGASFMGKLLDAGLFCPMAITTGRVRHVEVNDREVCGGMLFWIGPYFFGGTCGSKLTELTEQNPEMSALCQEQWLRVAHACLKTGQVLRTNQNLVPASQ